MVKNETFYNKIFCNQNNIGLKYFADIRFGMFQSNLIDKNIKFSEIKILQCIKNDVVVNFYDVIRIAHCAINIDMTRPVVILTFELTLYVTKRKTTMQVYFVVLKMPGLKYSYSNIITILKHENEWTIYIML